ncbi:hypothetical protein CERSUDRAFT_127231 [Gelatoporia subvermispora B]|uniref:Helicase C-terminal domain-containing protein n=1 Tax=Ceriporiopsis subvermispora (strain B) TaxID=914234 RepID=M2P8E5_CERS8|nr:hypothetical protein CERSUDRAFT_127231 [Gelatoporia subvermispora B]
MPSKTHTGLLLDLDIALNGQEGAPWTWLAWNSRTNLSGLPWSPGADDTDGLTEKELQEARSFVHKYAALKAAERGTFLSAKHDANAPGRQVVRSYLQKKFKAWKIVETTNEALRAKHCDIYSILRISKTKEATNWNQSQLHIAYEEIALQLFGVDALQHPGMPFLKRGVSEFVEDLAALEWNKSRKVAGRERDGLESRKKQIQEDWHALAASKSIDLPGLKKYLALVEKQSRILSRYWDAESVQELDNRKQEVRDMMDAIRRDTGGAGDAASLPKNIRKALQLLADSVLVESITNYMVDIVAIDHEDEDEGEAVELPDLDEDAPTTWTEGTEEFAAHDLERIKDDLGILKGDSIPMLNTWQDNTGTIDAWSPEFDENVATKTDISALRPRWHQYVAVLKIMLKMISGDPILLMDDVGIGKTLVLTAIACCRAWYHMHYKAHGAFPGLAGKRGMKCETTADGNFEDLPTLLVCPPALHPQWTEELHRYLKKGSFDLFPYTGKVEKRAGFWNEWSKSHQPLSRRILLATSTAIQSDLDYCFAVPAEKWKMPIKRPTYDALVVQTIFNQQWGLFVIDEAHVIRGLNKTYSASLLARSLSQMTVASTATPVLTRPGDLWNMGRMVGLETFDIDFDDDAATMARELRKASAQDLKMRKQSKSTEVLIRSLVSGEGSAPANLLQNSSYRQVSTEWIERIRSKFSGSVIRRTVDSLDWAGRPISGLEPYTEHTLMLDLCEHERKNLEQLADALLAESREKVHRVREGRSFYLSIRRALTHPGCNPGHGHKNAQSLEEWDKYPSAKLIALIQVLFHHLASDGAPPLRSRAGNILESTESGPDVHPPGAGPDKIVVYIAFPSNLDIIGNVLTLHGIRWVTINGAMTVHARQKALREFKNAGREGPRVMIMSGVGMVGMNIAFANLLVVLDTLWSAQEDSQLIGRVQRYPQQKLVRIYRIILRSTPDIFLNNLAFRKAEMHEAFVGSSLKLQRAFTQDSWSLDEEDGDTSPDKAKGSALLKAVPVSGFSTDDVDDDEFAGFGPEVSSGGTTSTAADCSAGDGEDDEFAGFGLEISSDDTTSVAADHSASSSHRELALRRKAPPSVATFPSRRLSKAARKGPKPSLKQTRQQPKSGALSSAAKEGGSSSTGKRSRDYAASSQSSSKRRRTMLHYSSGDGLSGDGATTREMEKENEAPAALSSHPTLQYQDVSRVLKSAASIGGELPARSRGKR